MVGDPMHPLAAQFAILATRDERRVLARDRRLIDEAVERPGLHLAFVELAVMQKAVERMQIVVAHGSDGPQRRLERLGGHRFRRGMYVHWETSIPSNAISQPAAFTFASSGDPSMRTGFELLIWMRMRRTCAWRASDSSVPPGPDTGMWPMRLPVLSPRPLAIISSSANNVPSKNNTSALAMRASRSSLTRAQPGA